jgi:hypothetical protein
MRGIYTYGVSCPLLDPESPKSLASGSFFGCIFFFFFSFFLSSFFSWLFKIYGAMDCLFSLWKELVFCRFCRLFWKRLLAWCEQIILQGTDHKECFSTNSNQRTSKQIQQHAQMSKESGGHSVSICRTRLWAMQRSHFHPLQSLAHWQHSTSIRSEGILWVCKIGLRC